MCYRGPMSQKQAIARKYRPQTFSAVCHQQTIITTLKNALKGERTAQSYLFCGTRGTGKTTLARLLAKALNCENLSSAFEPCNTCPSCQDINNGSSLDVIEIDGASNRGIDDIRQINETVGYAPSRSKWKIYIIDEVHMLTKEAFNALLKTLEEPPPRVKFFFATTEPHKVLPTITSRCQRFDLGRIPESEIRRKLQSIACDLNRSVEPSAFDLLAQLADGSMRDAESIFDQILCYTTDNVSYDAVSTMLGLASKSIFFELDNAVKAADLGFAFVCAQKIFDTGKDLKQFLESLVHHFRIILRLHLKVPTPLTAHDKPGYERALKSYSAHQTLDILDYLVEWMQRIPASPFKRVDLEMVLLYILRINQRIPLDTLIDRLHILEKQIGTLPNEEPLEPSLNTSIVQREPIAAPPPKPEPVAAPEPAAPPPKPEPVVDEPQPAANEPAMDTGHVDTLMRFAAVELNGSIQT